MVRLQPSEGTSVATIRFPSTDGVELSGDLRFPEEAAEHGGVAVLCHPHPSFGGSKESWMLPVLQSALVARGWVALRFDFRGVGGSEGEHGGGDGEVADVAGAVDRMLEHGDGPVLIVGWSFGAAVSLRHAISDERVDGWIGVSLPVASDTVDDDLLEQLAGWSVPKLFVHGSGDQLTSTDTIEEVVTGAAEPKRLRVIAGGDHLLMAQADELTEEVVRFAGELQAIGEDEG